MVAVTLAYLMLAASCTKDDGASPSLPGSSMPASGTSAGSSASSPSPSGAEAEVLQTYRKLQDAVTEAYAHPKRSPREVARYAHAKARSDIYATVLHYREERIRLSGKPRISPRVTYVDEKAMVATVTDCFDDSDWTPVDAKTGKSVGASGQNHRYPVTARLKRIKGRWYVVSAKVDRGKTCTPG